MIFSELYSAYYNTVAKIMEAAFNPEATEKDLQRCVMEEAFSESVLTILPALKSRKWPLLHEDLSPVLLHKPTMPLTNLEKRWLKAIAEDPRVKLFDVAFPELNDVEPLFTKRLERSLGTLGGGNHFIEIDAASDGTKYLVIHSGSRNLGKQVAELYQSLAIDLNAGKADYFERRDELIRTYKEQGRRAEIQTALKAMEKEWAAKEPTIPADLALSLGLYFGERNTGIFHNHFIEFSSRPQLIEIKGKTFAERLEYLCTFNEVADTNVEAVFDNRKKAICGENRNSYSKTDTDATFMHMKDDHMRNGQLKPGYNVQFAVNSGFITGIGVFSNRTDFGTLIPFLTYLWHKHGKSYRNVVADSGYESLANYRWLFENGQTAFIKPANYESGKKRSSKSQVGRMENMGYYEPDDCFICKNGRHLDLSSHYTSHAKDGTERKISAYRCEDCSGCLYRAACCKAKDSEKRKEIFVCWEFQNLRKNSYHNITTEEGKLLRCNRSIQAEGAFGQLKHNRNFKRFLTGGKVKVLAELLFLGLSQNIAHLLAKCNSGLQNLHLIQPKAYLNF